MAGGECGGGSHVIGWGPKGDPLSATGASLADTTVPGEEATASANDVPIALSRPVFAFADWHN